jgi:tRNA-binding EMAP/Myf-like protein
MKLYSMHLHRELVLYIDELGKYYYCPLKRNRLVDDTSGQENYKRIELLPWDKQELKSGKIIKIKKFPGAKKVKLFRVTVSTDRTDFIATNDLSQDSTDVVQKVCKVCLRHANANDGKLRSFIEN